MTLPDERTRSLISTQRLLRDLLNAQDTPRVPKEIRKRAYWCLRHFPSAFDINLVACVDQTVFAQTPYEPYEEKSQVPVSRRKNPKPRKTKK